MIGTQRDRTSASWRTEGPSLTMNDTRATKRATRAKAKVCKGFFFKKNKYTHVPNTSIESENKFTYHHNHRMYRLSVAASGNVC